MNLFSRFARLCGFKTHFWITIFNSSTPGLRIDKCKDCGAIRHFRYFASEDPEQYLGDPTRLCGKGDLNRWNNGELVK